MGSSKSISIMKTLIVLSCALAAAQCAVVLPHVGAYTYPVHSVAKSTIKFKTAAFEPVDAATPAATQKLELIEKEHEQEILTPTITYATAPVVHAPYYHHAAVAAPVVHAAATVVHAATPV